MSTTFDGGSGYFTGHQQSEAYRDIPKVPWLLMAALAIGTTAIMIGVKAYQHVYSWSVGLDAWAPEFQSYWMTVFYSQIIIIPVVGMVGAIALWFTRDRNIQNLPAIQELNRLYLVFSVLLVAGLLVSSTFGLLVEADAAWHQVVIRDTDFTPTHIFLFYLGVPGIMVGLSLAWLWVHTRLPYFAHRISWPLSLAMLGFVMVGPVVAFNEWAHTFFYAEELFGAPVHWFFVLAIFCLVFLAGFTLQCLMRFRQLTQKIPLEDLEQKLRT